MKQTYENPYCKITQEGFFLTYEVKNISKEYRFFSDMDCKSAYNAMVDQAKDLNKLKGESE